MIPGHTGRSLVYTTYRTGPRTDLADANGDTEEQIPSTLTRKIAIARNEQWMKEAGIGSIYRDGPRARL